MEEMQPRAAHPLHPGRAALSGVKGALLFLALPLALIAVFSTLIASQNIPLSTSFSSASNDIIAIGTSIVILSMLSSLMGMERMSGLALRAGRQVASAVYAVVVAGRGYSLIVDGNFSLSFSLLPIALAMAALSLLGIIPALFEHAEKRANIH